MARRLASCSTVLFRIQASHFLWKMVRKLVSYLAEVGRGNAPVNVLARTEPWQPTAPPCGLFLEAITYGEPFERPLQPIVPVVSR